VRIYCYVCQVFLWASIFGTALSEQNKVAVKTSILLKSLLVARSGCHICIPKIVCTRYHFQIFKAELVVKISIYSI